MKHSEGSPEEEVHSNSDLLKESRKISNKQIALHLKDLEEQQQSPEQIEERK